jgi:uncharacterized protein (DUF488 family)
MLESFKIELLADIRTFPGSRFCPQFNGERLEKSLAEAAIEYIHMPQLGGRRKTKADSKNTAWRNASFRGYADYMETDEFKKGIAELEGHALKKPTVYMCAEAYWLKCHRSLVSDYLKSKGWTVHHITGVDKSTEHEYTQPAHIRKGKLSYAGAEE